MFRSLLSFSEDTPESARDLVKLPQVDRMCALLMDTGRTGSAVRIKKTFFAHPYLIALYRVTQFALPCLPLSSRSRLLMRMPY